MNNTCLNSPNPSHTFAFCPTGVVGKKLSLFFLNCQKQQSELKFSAQCFEQFFLEVQSLSIVTHLFNDVKIVKSALVFPVVFW